MKKIRVITINTDLNFIGEYRPDLEKTNWHYYETEKKAIIHIRKEHFVAVVEENI